MDQPPPPSPPARHSKPRRPRQHPPSPRPVAADKETEIHSIECWIYKGAQPTQSECNIIHKNDIASWLAKPGPSSFDDLPPVAGLRLVCRQQTASTEPPFDEATLKAINKVLGLPESHDYLVTCNAGACGKYVAKGGQPIFLYHRSNNNGTISTVLRYDSVENITVGYLLLGPRISAPAVRATIQSQFAQFSHPLLVPTVLMEQTAADLMKELHDIHTHLAKVEIQTGYGDWDGAVAAASAADADHDYQQLARMLGSLNCRYAFMDVAVRCTISMSDFTMKEMDEMKAYATSSRFRQLQTVSNSECLRQRIELLASNLRHIEMFGAIRERMQAQQNVLFNLISQRDNDLNIGIARASKELAAASKRDSSAMKIIALMTTLFLPGTFIATFFAMPLFDWSAATMTHVMSNHFWIYWAVAAPLTVAVMAIMGFYAWHQRGKNRDERRAAREEAGTKEA